MLFVNIDLTIKRTLPYAAQDLFFNVKYLRCCEVVLDKRNSRIWESIH